MRPHVAAVYAFARVADDIADEGSARAGRSAGAACVCGRIGSIAPPQSKTPGEVDDRAALDRDALIAIAIGHSIRSLDLPLPLFDDLLSAFGQDTMTTRYASWADVFDYCRRSANPIGRLVLRIAGYRDERSIDRRMRCAPRCSSRISGRTSAGTGGPAGSTCRARSRSRAARSTPSSRAAASAPPGIASWRARSR